MAHRKSKGSHKKHKSNKHREKKNTENIDTIVEENAQKVGEEVYGETIIQDSLEANVSDIHTDESTAETSSDKGSETTPTDGNNDMNVNNNSSNADSNNDNSNMSADINDFCEDIKAKQQEIFNKLKNLSEAFTDITLIRDDVNSLRVDTLTEVYFTRQVRPLLDALNIIAFATSNVSNTATVFQSNAFGDTKEIKNALKLSYRMNDEVDDIIDALGRRLKIFVKQIDNIDKNCPPFD